MVGVCVLTYKIERRKLAANIFLKTAETHTSCFQKDGVLYNKEKGLEKIQENEIWKWAKTGLLKRVLVKKMTYILKPFRKCPAFKFLI